MFQYEGFHQLLEMWYKVRGWAFKQLVVETKTEMNTGESKIYGIPCGMWYVACK